jgi:Domain of Unknown Function (DUF1543)
MSAASSNTDNELVLFSILLGCKPKGRNIEQHDIFFGVAKHLSDLTNDIKVFWYKAIIHELSSALKKVLPGLDSEAMNKELLKTLSRRDKVHIDAWTKVQYVDGYKVSIVPKTTAHAVVEQKLYFINLGGYKENEFEEYHKKLFVVATRVSEALEKVRSHSFMKEYSPECLGPAGGAHLDDQYKIGFEADDVVCVSEAIGNDYHLLLEAVESHPADQLMVGYTQLNYCD